MKSVLEEWAKNNALTLAFVTVLFIILMIWIPIAVWFFGGGISGG